MNIRLFDILMFWRKIKRKYEAIEQDPQKKESDTSLGKSSLTMSIAGIILTVGFAVLAALCAPALQNVLWILGVIGIFVCAFLALICYVNLVLASFVYAYYQLKLNKNKIGKTAMIASVVINVITIIAVIVAVVLSQVLNTAA